MPLHDAAQYVFVDESGVTTDLLRRYARSLCGDRVSDHTPCSHWQTHTVVAALRPTEMTATAVFDGPIDTASFRAYVEQVLVPTLRHGDVVVLDNLAVHKTTRGAGRDREQWLPATVSSTLQSRLQSDRASVRQIESVPTGGATPELRSRQRARGNGTRPLHHDRVSQLRPTLRLPRRYIDMENALAPRVR